jgi:hypothetical protein
MATGLGLDPISRRRFRSSKVLADNGISISSPQKITDKPCTFAKVAAWVLS